jgi:hypothetical protein
MLFLPAQKFGDVPASLRPPGASLCDNAQMTGPPPREPLWLPPNCRDVTAEKVGTVIGIVGATAAKPG